MSEHAGVHVHAPHEEAVEHGAHNDGLAQRVALTTAILATIGALFGYQSGQVQTEAMLLKNDSISRITKASDQWSFYQAKSTREFISTSLAQTAADEKVREKYKKEAERYGREKEEIRQGAQKLDHEAERLSQESEAKVPPHERMALGVALMQVAVALASITVLTRKSWLYVGALIFAGVGIAVASWGYLAPAAPDHAVAAHALEQNNGGSHGTPKETAPGANADAAKSGGRCRCGKSVCWLRSQERSCWRGRPSPRPPPVRTG